MSERRLTGRHVLAIAVGAFGIIIGVNLVMAWQAISTFPGLEVKNSYVASQSFDAERAAQEALGWTAEPAYENGTFSITLRDRDGLPAPVTDISVLVGRTTHVRDDRTPVLVNRGGVYSAPLDLAPGIWLIHLEASAADGTPFRQRIDFVVKG